MSDFRRRFVRLSVFLLPAFALLAALNFARGDLRDAVAGLLSPGYRRGGHTFVMKGKARANTLGDWINDSISRLQERDRIYSFKIPKSGFRIEVRSEAGPSECDPGSNRILIRGIADDAPVEKIQPDLSRLIVRAMLREGAPDATYSPWFEEGVSRFYEGTQTLVGSRKDELIAIAARNPPASLAEALGNARGAYHEAVSHSIVAFLHDAFPVEKIAEYAALERKPGPVPAGTFERLFGQDVEKEWRDYLERKLKGS